MQQERAQGPGAPSGPYERPAPQPPQPRPPGGLFRGCLIAIMVVGVLGLLAVFGIIILVVLVGAPQMAARAAPSQAYEFREVTLDGRPGDPKIVCIAVEGIIGGSTVPGMDYGQTSLTVGKLRRARQDDGVRGVILYVDSPGGGITASDILHREVKELRKGRGGKPVVACLMDVAASGGYYVSVGADYIVAHPTTITGSIGVMMPLYDASGLLKKIGVRDETMATGEFKSLGSPFKEKSEEQKRVERELLQAVIAQMHERFVSVVADGRNLEPEKVLELADGRIFTGPDALKHGLIDEIGYESDAIAQVKKLTKATRVHLVRYQRMVSLRHLLGAFARGPKFTLDVRESLPGPQGARPMFLWRPPALGNDD